MKIQSTQKVRELVSMYPGASPVLEHFGIDYIQQGEQSISNACAAAQIIFRNFERQLQEGSFHSGEDVTFWKTARLTDLVGHIVERHHGFIRRQSPKIKRMLHEIIRANGRRYAEVHEILNIFCAITKDMGQHEEREEQLVFPYIVEMEAANSGVPAPRGVDGLIFAMMQEHSAASGLREMITELTHHYVPPINANTELAELYKTLFDFDCDLHRHLYLENDVLYPRALKLFYKSRP